MAGPVGGDAEVPAGRPGDGALLPLSEVRSPLRGRSVGAAAGAHDGADGGDLHLHPAQLPHLPSLGERGGAERAAEFTQS